MSIFKIKVTISILQKGFWLHKNNFGVTKIEFYEVSLNSDYALNLIRIKIKKSEKLEIKLFVLNKYILMYF